jgi:hypothetical protein
VSTFGARGYVGRYIEEDCARGIPICPLAETFAMGRRSPYASLPSVDAFRHRKESPPGVASKIPMTADNAARFFKRT